MKTVYKVLISFVIGVCLICIGIGFGGIQQMKVPYLLGLDNFQLIWSADKEDNIQYHVESTINELELNTTRADIEFYEKENLDDIEVKVSNVYSGFQINEENHKLVIYQPHYWFNYDDNKKLKIQIMMPQGYQFKNIDINANIGATTIENINTEDLYIENSMGKLTLNQVVCHNLDIDTGMSQTDLKHVNCQNHLNVDVGMGEVNILLNNRQLEYNYSVDVGMGSVQIGNEKFSGLKETHSHNESQEQHIDVDCGMGSVKIEMEDKK